MPASRDENVANGSDDDLDAVRAPGRSQARRAVARDDARDFEVTRTWDLLTESADGTITGAVEGLLEAGKRKRYYLMWLWGTTAPTDRSLDSSRTRHHYNVVSFDI
jgi:ketosteroid isomerase-like protein